MIARFGGAEWRAMLPRRFIASAAAVVVLVWIGIVAANGVLLATRSFALPFLPVPAKPALNFSTPDMWLALGIITGACLGAALLARGLAPAATLPTAIVAGLTVQIAAAMSTSSLGAVLVVFSLFALCWLVGDALLARLPPAPQALLVRAPLAISIGTALCGTYLLGLTSVGRLNAVAVCGSALVVLAVLALDRLRRGPRGARQVSLLPFVPTWFETLVIGLVVGLLAYATLGAFAPEIHSDAFRHHLPIAREVWQTGSSPEFPPMWTSTWPIQAHLLYAVAYGFGGMTAAKLVHAVVGLLTIVTMSGIGWLVAGRVAAVTGAAVLAAMPLLLWELGTAYVDLFPAWFTASAALAILLWQRAEHPAWLLTAGVLAGVGFASKMTMGVTIVALAASIGIVGRAPWRFRHRLQAVATFGMGTLVVLPWLLRSYLISGSVPGVSILADHLTGRGAAHTSDLTNYGLGRSPLDLLRIPWALTFEGELFNQVGSGDVGIAFLLLLPLIIFVPRTRPVAFLAVAAVVSYLGWVFTAQYTRYMLPTLVLVAALYAVAVASATSDARASRGLPLIPSWQTVGHPAVDPGQQADSPLRRISAWAVPVGITLSLVAAPLLFLPNPKSTIPVDVITGRLSPTAYVARKFPAATALSAASSFLPPDTPIAFFGVQQEGAQIYTEARLVYFSADPVGMTPVGILNDFDLLGTTAEEVLASLERLGVKHFIWSRAESRPEDWRSTLFSTEFLRQHTRILAAANNAYLFEVVPDTAEWVVAGGNLLADSELETVGRGGPWTGSDRAKSRKGVVLLAPRDTIAQRVPIAGASAFLLLSSGQCHEPDDAAELTLRWLDNRNDPIGVVTEKVFPGTKRSDQFLWSTAPNDAVAVSVELSTSYKGSRARCEFDKVALYSSSR